ncbi:hypothetical protein [Nocardia sp. NPDC049707]|uniref:hypothetical protein n=1 Tax=Nocardia sp. NPDC049707 TaxID=3154735 RepID=UPI003441410C
MDDTLGAMVEFGATVAIKGMNRAEYPQSGAADSEAPDQGGRSREWEGEAQSNRSFSGRSRSLARGCGGSPDDAKRQNHCGCGEGAGDFGKHLIIPSHLNCAPAKVREKEA